MSHFRNFLVGKEIITSRKEFKYALLRGQFACIICSVAFFYTILDSINHVKVFIPWYGLLAGLAFTSLLLNRKKYYTAATILQLILINSLIFLFADVDHPYGGVFFFFMTCSSAGLILLNFYDRSLSLVFALLPILLGYLAFTQDLKIIPPPMYEEGMVRINFIANLTIGIVSNVFVVFFLINRNSETEKTLRDSEKHLIKISADLKVSEERFAMALTGTRAGIYEWKVKNNLISVSIHWKSLLGYEENELNDLTLQLFLSFIHPEDQVRTSQSIESHLHDHRPYQNELRIRTKGGEYKWFQDSGVSKLDEEGNITVVIGSIIDINERKRAEEELALKNVQLAKTNEELDRFVYSASHDMRAPLSSLLGLIHLSEKTDRPEEVSIYLQMMKDRIKTMEGFIREVTDYSRNTRLDIAAIQVSLLDLVQEVVQNLAYSIVNKKVRIEVDIEKNLTIHTDISRLKVVITNLLSNAYKYHFFDQPDPYIIISAVKRGEIAIITVKDNGRGIANEHHARIFEMFYRASENSEGSGLGLYIVKETLDKLRGSISVQSAEGSGSEFTVTLPAVK
ncbi:MAG: PAS domain-containing sensor histidine kinase [Cyclobacteriaceae bacterium]